MTRVNQTLRDLDDNTDYTRKKPGYRMAVINPLHMTVIMAVIDPLHMTQCKDVHSPKLGGHEFGKLVTPPLRARPKSGVPQTERGMHHVP